MLKNRLLEFVQGRLNNYSIIFIVCVLTIHSALFASVTTQPPAGLCHVEHVHSVQCNLREESKPDTTTKAQIQENYGKIPLYFIKNEGQMDKKVKYYEKGSGHAMFFTKEGVYLSLTGGQEREARRQKAEGKGLKAEGSGLKKEGSGSAGAHPPQVSDHEDRRYNALKLVKLIPIGANKNPEIVAEGLQECRVNYFVGNDPEKWKTGITTYSVVVYKDIYDGIDLKFYGNNRQLEYDVIVRSGADPSKVRFAYEGIEDLRVDDNGDLEIILNSHPLLRGAGRVSERTEKHPPESPFTKGDLRKDGLALPFAKTQDRLNPSFTIIQKKPYVYQNINGKKVEVHGEFKLSSLKSKVKNQKLAAGNSKLKTKNLQLATRYSPRFTYSFQVASYDKHYPLIIDPKLVYSTYLGGSDWDGGEGIAVDTSGNVYATGKTVSTDFPTANAIYGNYAGGDFDVFVTKLNASGSALVYSTYLGGSDWDEGEGIAVDTSGNVYVTGLTVSTDFPTANAIYGVDPGNTDVFVTKLNASGSALVYSTYLGGSGWDSGEGIAVDTSGNVYVTGRTESTDFPTANAIYGSYAGGDFDVFVTKLNASGSALVYSTYLGGSDWDEGEGIAVDTSGNVYVTGLTVSTDFPTANAIYGNNSGSADVFVTKLNASGSALVYSTYLGGTDSTDFGEGIAVDTSGNVYVTGTTASTDFPTANAIYGGNIGYSDVFVTKINASGSALVYSTYVGGSDWDFGYGITVDTSGNVYVTGTTASTDFPTANAIYGSYAGGDYDVFVTKLNASGSALVYSTYLGGSDWDEGEGIAVDTSSNVYVTGYTASTDFPTANAIYGNYAGNTDAFVTKISYDAPIGMVYGTVNDSYEDTLEGVTVTIVGEGISDSTETDEEGYYEFQGLAAGDYTLTYEKEDYVTQKQEISLEEGETKELETIMPLMSTNYGYVVNVKGEPINKARLKLKGINTKYVTLVYSDGDGYFEFTGLEADTYLIFARKKGYLPKKIRVKLEEGEAKDVGEITLRRKS